MHRRLWLFAGAAAAVLLLAATATATTKVSSSSASASGATPAAAPFAQSWANVPRTTAARKAKSVVVFGMEQDIDGFNTNLTCCNAFWAGVTGNVPVTRIKKGVLQLLLEASRESFPDEFAGQLRAKEGTIHELTMLPGTLQGRTSALVNLWMLPIDYSVVGSVHSHPSGNYSPSEEDRAFFRKFGSVHIIAGRPYTLRTWQAYDEDGEPVSLEVVE